MTSTSVKMVAGGWWKMGDKDDPFRPTREWNDSRERERKGGGAAGGGGRVVIGVTDGRRVTSEDYVG